MIFIANDIIILDMVSYKTTRILQRIFLLLIIIVAIVGVFLIWQAVSSADKSPSIDAGREALLKTSDNYGVRLSVRGPIVADEDFRSYKIFVSPSVRELQTYEGYKSKSLKQIKLNNNTPAYEQFIYALDKAGFMNGDGELNNRGVCSGGYVYEFETLKDEKTVKKIWTSSCNNVKDTANSNVRHISRLFLSQVKGGELLVKELW